MAACAASAAAPALCSASSPERFGPSADVTGDSNRAAFSAPSCSPRCRLVPLRGFPAMPSQNWRRGNGRGSDGNSHERRVPHRQVFACRAVTESSVGSFDWLLKASPYEVLGVSEDSSEEDIKSAFRAMIKEYHPDVYQGLGDADAITQRLLQAYELLMVETGRKPFERKNLDPFENPECVAADIFVNEVACIGRGCPYSCVERAPDIFQFANDTGRARVINQEAAYRKAGEYHVQLAVGQCPNNCIHVVTPQQRLRLEEILKSVLEGTIYSGEMMIMDGLIARAAFENGRYQRPKRKPKRTEEWVDWY